jgi:hypothetical protein
VLRSLPFLLSFGPFLCVFWRFDGARQKEERPSVLRAARSLPPAAPTTNNMLRSTVAFAASATAAAAPAAAAAASSSTASAIALPSRYARVQLYRTLLRTAANFHDYNFRAYAQRRVKEKVSAAHPHGLRRLTAPDGAGRRVLRRNPHRRQPMEGDCCTRSMR